MLKVDIKVFVVCSALLNLVWSNGYDNCGFGNTGVGGGDGRGAGGGKGNGASGGGGNSGAAGKGSAGGSKGENNRSPLKETCCECPCSKKKDDYKKGSNDKKTDATEKPRKRCCPYNFDSTQCKIVNDRLLCGYDNNFGGAAAFNDKDIQLPGGRCRLRGKRIECGYLQPPYTNPRRPPPHRKLPYVNSDTEEDKKHPEDQSSNEEEAGSPLKH